MVQKYLGVLESVYCTLYCILSILSILHDFLRPSKQIDALPLDQSSLRLASAFCAKSTRNFSTTSWQNCSPMRPGWPWGGRDLPDPAFFCSFCCLACQDTWWYLFGWELGQKITEFGNGKEWWPEWCWNVLNADPSDLLRRVWSGLFCNVEPVTPTVS